LRKGITIDSIVFGPIEAQLERVQGANAWIAVSLTEGKNREIKRVMQYLGLDVTRLIRISYGPFQLADLPEGAIEEVRLKVLRDQLGKQLAELADVDFSSPVRELTATEKQQLRERLDTRSRKHVSVLRQQREELNKKGPRTRIEKSATADRRGRAVTVERIAPAKPDRDPDKNSRNARRFDALRDNRSWGGSRSSLSSPDASAGYNRGGSSDFRNKQRRHKHTNSTYAADDQEENPA
jgi:23S rRNA pseudouridine2605 synthase